MMNLIRLLIVPVMLFTLLQNSKAADRIFNSSQGGFMFIYPGSWIDSTPLGSDISAAVKATGAEAETGANCLVVSKQDPTFEHFAQPQTAAELLEILGADFCQATAPKEQDVVVHYAGTTFVDNIPALLCKASGTRSDIRGTFRIKTIYVALLKPPSAYTIQCYALEAYYDEVEPTFINLIASFNLMDK